MPSLAQNRKRKKAAKEYALTHYITIPKGFAWQPGFVGKPARELIRRIQLHAWPKQAPTGTFDTRTLALLFPAKPVGLRAVAIAGTQIGIKEHPAGTNTGPAVVIYQHATNPGQTGFPWCASFVTWCLRQAEWKVSFASMAYVPAWVAAAHSGKYPLMVIAKSEAEEGDIVTYDWDNDTVADHIGFVLSKPDGNGKFNAREGNTAVGNDSNGGEVMDRQRSTHDVCCFIRLKS